MTIKDIAELANVSVSTVSKVINDKADHIPDETKNKVLAAIKENNYVPYKKALDKWSRVAAAGLLISDVSDIFCAELAKGVEDYFFSKNYSLIICNTYENVQKEQQYIEMLKKRNIQGIIRFPLPNISSEAISDLEEDEICSVILDNYKQVPNVLKTYFHNREGGRIAVRHLIENLHRRIGYISRETSAPYLMERYEGYKLALAENGIELDERLCYISKEQDRKKAGYDGAKYLMSQEVTAIFCCDDRVAAGAYEAISETDYNIPRDISIVGFDDSMICEMLTPGLTSIKQPAYEIGRKSAAMLYNKINGVEPDGKEISILPKLSSRSSVAMCAADGELDKKAVVIGELRMDLILRLSEPQTGGAQLVEGEDCRPGGWGLERALELRSSATEVYFIGRVGNDAYGRELYENLMENGIRTDGLVFDETLPTGSAWIATGPERERKIIRSGANEALDGEQITSFRWIFDKVKYCYIDTRLPAELAARINEICSDKKIRVLGCVE